MTPGTRRQSEAAGRPAAERAQVVGGVHLLGVGGGAEEAREWGIINRVVPDAELEANALALARALEGHWHEDLRERTIRSLGERYHADLAQAGRVQATALELLRTLFTQAYERGKPVTKLKNAGAIHNRRGTTIRFRPDPEIFGKLSFSAAEIKE